MARSIIRIWDAWLAYLDLNHDWVKWLAISITGCDEFTFVFLYILL
jgi:hypothetical protein